jgi:hypothetical protein
VPEPRNRTIAFRVTTAEGDVVDALARRLEIKPSEFARRSMFNGALTSKRALAQAREEGRAGPAGELARLQLSYAELMMAYEAWRRKAESLKAEQRASEPLLEAVMQLIARAPDARMEVARLWSRIPVYPDREQVLPIVAAKVADRIEEIVGFSTSGQDFARWPQVRRRIEWLFDALRPDAGQDVHRTSWNARVVWKPVMDAVTHADEDRARAAPDFIET